jgi:hypothetical protein
MIACLIRSLWHGRTSHLLHVKGEFTFLHFGCASKMIHPQWMWTMKAEVFISFNGSIRFTSFKNVGDWNSECRDWVNKFNPGRGMWEILETRKKRRPCRWWVKPWIRRPEQLGVSTQLLVELAAEDCDSCGNHLRMSEAQLDFLLQKVSPLIQKADTFLRPALPENVYIFALISFTLNWGKFNSLCKTL